MDNVNKHDYNSKFSGMFGGYSLVRVYKYSIFKLRTGYRKCFSVRSEPLIVFT